VAEAFRWSTTRRVTRTATVSLEGNICSVDPALVGRRVELRYQPEDLERIEVFRDSRPAGIAKPFVIGRHTAKAVPQAARPDPPPTGVDYLGMVAAAHDAEIVGAISYANVPFTVHDNNDVDGDQDQEDWR
jgi:putative transposase